VRASCVVSQLASVVLFLIMFNCISLLGIRYARGFISLSVVSMAPSLIMLDGTSIPAVCFLIEMHSLMICTQD
jgi:hypothetical protein